MMTRKIQKKNTGLPASSVSGTERKLKMKLERKEQPTDKEAVLFRTHEERLKAVDMSLRSSKGYFKRVNKISPGVRGRFVKFAREAREDLRVLAREGANPFVVMQILYTNVWYGWRGDRDRVQEEHLSSMEEMRKLSSQKLWAGGRTRLERASEFLKDLTSCLWVSQAIRGFTGGSDDNPFIRLSKDIAKAEVGVDSLLKTIGELGLCEDGWMWSPRLGTVNLLKGSGKGRRKSGRGREEDWALCATELQFYLRRRTGKPHWGTIARLLHFAGYTYHFPIAIPREGERVPASKSGVVDSSLSYRERIRDRVKGLWQIYGTRYTVTARISDWEQLYEVNPELPDGLVRTRLTVF